MGDILSKFIIVNPQSAGGATGQRWPQLAAQLESAIGPFDVLTTNAPGHATELARQAADKGATRLIAIGGDGTVNEVINGIMAGDPETRPALGLIDAGTGGDFARNINLPLDLDGQLDVLRRGTTRPIGLGLADYCDMEGKQARRYFAVLCSFGISSAINAYVNGHPQLKRWGNSAAFTWAAMRTLMTFDNVPVAITVDGQLAYDGPALLCSACNGPLVGGGMKLAPDASAFDPDLAFMVGGDIRLARRLRLFAGIYDGNHIGRPNVQDLKGMTLSANSHGDAPVYVDMDGDLVGTLPLSVRAISDALQVMCPA